MFSSFCELAVPAEWYSEDRTVPQPGTSTKRRVKARPNLGRRRGRLFVAIEAEAAAIRTAFGQRGELSAAVELHLLFPADTARAMECACTIARLEGTTRGTASGQVAGALITERRRT